MKPIKRWTWRRRLCAHVGYYRGPHGTTGLMTTSTMTGTIIMCCQCKMEWFSSRGTPPISRRGFPFFSVSRWIQSRRCFRLHELFYDVFGANLRKPNRH